MAASFGKPLGADLGPLSVYASWWPATGGNPGRDVAPPMAGQGFGPEWANTENPIVKVSDPVREFFENWMPFTAWIFDRFIAPRPPTASWQSPFDVDASERITRFGPYPSAERPFPYPYEIGAVSGFMPMLDQYSMAWAWGKTPNGPGVLTPIPVPWQASYPNLQKVTG